MVQQVFQQLGTLLVVLSLQKEMSCYQGALPKPPSKLQTYKRPWYVLYLFIVTAL